MYLLPAAPAVQALQDVDPVPLVGDAKDWSSWNTVLGRMYVYQAITTLLPNWTTLRDFQIRAWALTLARKHLFAILATGSGKTSLFYGPLLVARYYIQYPTPYLKPPPPRPVMLVIIPLKELGNNQVRVLRNLLDC
jgi:ATP-dependent helicase YprA (DUF1998 family)